MAVKDTSPENGYVVIEIIFDVKMHLCEGFHAFEIDIIPREFTVTLLNGSLHLTLKE